MKFVAYHRISTKNQHLERGVAAIQQFCKEQGISLYKNKIYTDQQTGKNFNRPGYLIVKEELLESEDTLIISEIDRLGRNKEETLKELRYFKENNIRVMILEIPTTLINYEKMDNTLAVMLMDTVNNMLIEMYATFAQAEMEKRERRQKEGIEQMKIRGEWDRYGRPKSIDPVIFAKEFQKVENGIMRPVDLMKDLNMTPPTFYRYRKEYLKEKGALQQQKYLKKLKGEIEEMKENKIKLDEDQIQRAITGVQASMAIEGFELTEENKNAARLILSGEADADELLEAIIAKYKENMVK